MRLFVIITSLLAILTVLFRWRYRIMNMILAITILRKISVALTMKIPALRDKLLPLFLNRSNL
ncbi:hypothetical protein ACLIBG_06550 [Virgibacillus sp. W0181]|uniref:hypothetical protein n=1 Tax=Virgibacillus sp. W0181 TaxID=3391581 RepID=UPI003F45240C